MGKTTRPQKRTGRILQDVSELDTMPVGTAVEVLYLGTMFYEGRINRRHAFMTASLPKGQTSETPFISSLRGERPYLDGEGLLDFRSWAENDVYSPEYPQYQDKLRIIQGESH